MTARTTAEQREEAEKRALAIGAHRRAWILQRARTMLHVHDGGRPVCSIHVNNAEDAAFISYADPDFVLSLLADLREKEEDVEAKDARGWAKDLRYTVDAVRHDNSLQRDQIDALNASLSAAIARAEKAEKERDAAQADKNAAWKEYACLARRFGYERADAEDFGEVDVVDVHARFDAVIGEFRDDAAAMLKEWEATRDERDAERSSSSLLRAALAKAEAERDVAKGHEDTYWTALMDVARALDPDDERWGAVEYPSVASIVAHATDVRSRLAALESAARAATIVCETPRSVAAGRGFKLTPCGECGDCRLRALVAGEGTEEGA